MAEEEASVVVLRDDFYRDSFGKVIATILAVCMAALLMGGLSLYFYFSKPAPITFTIGPEWRIQQPVPLDQPYLSTPEVLQWVSDVLPRVFRYDFNHYNEQLKAASQYFTPDGWKAFLNQLNSYINYTNVQTYKMFVSSSPQRAPFILNQGLILGRYGWWVQMPLTIKYIGNNQVPSQVLKLQVLMVRVPTLNNLSGVGIDNIIVEKNPNNLAIGNG